MNQSHCDTSQSAKFYRCSVGHTNTLKPNRSKRSHQSTIHGQKEQNVSKVCHKDSHPVEAMDISWKRTHNCAKNKLESKQKMVEKIAAAYAKSNKQDDASQGRQLNRDRVLEQVQKEIDIRKQLPNNNQGAWRDRRGDYHDIDDSRTKFEQNHNDNKFNRVAKERNDFSRNRYYEGDYENHVQSRIRTDDRKPPSNNDKEMTCERYSEFDSVRYLSAGSERSESASRGDGRSKRRSRSKTQKKISTSI